MTHTYKFNLNVPNEIEISIDKNNEDLAYEKFIEYIVNNTDLIHECEEDITDMPYYYWKETI